MSYKAWMNLCYRHGHIGPEGIVEEARRSGLRRREEQKLKQDGREGNLPGALLQLELKRYKQGQYANTNRERHRMKKRQRGQPGEGN